MPQVGLSNYGSGVVFLLLLTSQSVARVLKTLGDPGKCS